MPLWLKIEIQMSLLWILNIKSSIVARVSVMAKGGARDPEDPGNASLEITTRTVNGNGQMDINDNNCRYHVMAPASKPS